MNDELQKSQLNLSELTSRLRKEDNRNINMTKRLKIFYFAFGALYALVFILHYVFDENNAWNDSLSGFFYVLAWIIFAFLFRKANKEYSQIDYSLPTVMMLNKAAKRYRLFQPRIIFAFGAALLIDIASSLNKIEIPLTEEALNDTLTFQVIFFSAILVGTIAGTIIWYKRQKPIRDNALALIKELES